MWLTMSYSTAEIEDLYSNNKKACLCTVENYFNILFINYHFCFRLFMWVQAKSLHKSKKKKTERIFLILILFGMFMFNTKK